MKTLRCTLLCMLVTAAPLAGQHVHEPGMSPYVDLLDRDIKALSEAEVESLLAGEGMSLALPAELNHYPGPRHVLELADSLELSQEQVGATRNLMDRMQSRARHLGEQIVEGERALDRAFSSGTIDETVLSRRVSELATLRGELRYVHLSAHLATKDLLTLHQNHRYSELRGYGSGHGAHGR